MAIRHSRILDDDRAAAPLRAFAVEYEGIGPSMGQDISIAYAASAVDKFSSGLWRMDEIAGQSVGRFFGEFL